MIIKELYLKNFGKFSGKRCRLDEHIQVFYGENEYGKSTMYAFIRAMLFGMERGRGRAAGKDEFSRYEPWENPNYYAGEMRFTCGGRMFCLKRQFDRYGRNAVLYCEDDGEELSVEDGDLKMLLGGISAVSFENTAAVGQLTARPGQTLAEELKNYAANYYASGSSEVDLKCAMDTLKERKKHTEREIKKCVETQKQELEKLEVKEQYIKNEMETLWESAVQIQAKLPESAVQIQAKLPEGAAQIQAKLREDVAQIQAEPPEDAAWTGNVLRRAWTVLCILGALLFIAGVLGVFLDDTWLGAVSELTFSAGAAALTVGIMGVLTGYIGAGHRRKGSLWDVTWIRRENAEDIQDESARAKWELQRLRAQFTEKQTELGNLQEQKEELLLTDDTRERLEEAKAAVELAMERLASCASGMTEQFGKRLNQEASQILETVTEGKYSRLFVEENLQMSVYCEGRRIAVEQLSRGTVEQIYFALRMAALDLLYEERVPVIFDDAFGCYDEKRLKSTLKWLSNQDRQVIIFSCQKREQEIIEGLKKEMSI